MNKQFFNQRALKCIERTCKLPHAQHIYFRPKDSEHNLVLAIYKRTDLDEPTVPIGPRTMVEHFATYWDLFSKSISVIGAYGQFDQNHRPMTSQEKLKTQPRLVYNPTQTKIPNYTHSLIDNNTLAHMYDVLFAQRLNPEVSMDTLPLKLQKELSFLQGATVHTTVE